MPVQEAEAEAEEFVEAEDEEEEEVEEEEEEVEYVDDADVDLDEVRPWCCLLAWSVRKSVTAERVHELDMTMHKVVPAAWQGRPLACRAPFAVLYCQLLP